MLELAPATRPMANSRVVPVPLNRSSPPSAIVKLLPVAPEVEPIVSHELVVVSMLISEPLPVINAVLFWAVAAKPIKSL